MHERNAHDFPLDFEGDFNVSSFQWLNIITDAKA